MPNAMRKGPIQGRHRGIGETLCILGYGPVRRAPTAAELVAKTGLRYIRIWQIMTGQRPRCSIEAFYSLSKALDVTMDQLYRAIQEEKREREREHNLKSLVSKITSG